MRFLRAWEDQKLITRTHARRYIDALRRTMRLVIPTPDVLDTALGLCDRYSLSHWDSMLLGACVAAGVDTLYTEDMGAPCSYDRITLINPFI